MVNCSPKYEAVVEYFIAAKLTVLEAPILLANLYVLNMLDGETELIHRFDVSKKSTAPVLNFLETKWSLVT